MRIIEKGIVFSYDIRRILSGNNALDFDYQKTGAILPSEDFYSYLRKQFLDDVNLIFNGNVSTLSEIEMISGLEESISDIKASYQMVSLDKIYLNLEETQVIFLDCTRLDNSNKLVSRNNISSFDAVENEIEEISRNLMLKGCKEIILVDDVVFSGSVLKTVIEEFLKHGIKVVGIRCAISTAMSYERFNAELPLGLKCGYLLGRSFIDQVCERDFYFGVAQSGISVISNNKIYKSPYFVPFGNPVARASIPEVWSKYFSQGCLKRSILLWSEIENLSKKVFKIGDLPETILGTEKNDEVVKNLKKELKRL